MTKISPDKAATVGDLLCRYMRARHRFADRVEQPLPSKLFAALISQGKAEFDEIYVEPEANPPVVLDGKAGFLFRDNREELQRDAELGPAPSIRMASVCAPRRPYAATTGASPHDLKHQGVERPGSARERVSI